MDHTNGINSFDAADSNGFDPLELTDPVEPVKIQNDKTELDLACIKVGMNFI